MQLLILKTKELLEG